MQQEMQITIKDLRGETARGKARGGGGATGHPQASSSLPGDVTGLAGAA